MFAFFRLPVAPLPQVDFATIRVQAQMAGASPDTMAATVAAPLERRLGAIADVTEMTSQSSTGTTSIILQFGLNRDINGAARDVQAAIAAARADLPAALKSNPDLQSKFNPADAPDPDHRPDVQDTDTRAPSMTPPPRACSRSSPSSRASATSISVAVRCPPCASS